MMIAQHALYRSRFAVVATLVLVMSGCGGQPAREHAVRSEHERPAVVARSSPSQSIEQRVVAAALDQVGIPYRFGGNDRSGFDCSGLVQYSYARAGRGVPRTTGQLWSATEAVGRHELEPGDLLFFNIAGKMSHVGLYVGDGHFVHAPSSGRTVSVADLRSAYYSKAFIRGGRVK